MNEPKEQGNLEAPPVETPPTETPPNSEAPPAEETPPAEEYVPLTADDITFPEGVTVDEPLRDEFLGILNNREQSPKEQLQALIDLQLKASAQFQEAGQRAFQEMQTQWQEEVRADSVVGGENLQPALGRIGRLIDEYGSPELTSVLDTTGAGNSVHVVKFLDALASKLTEGAPVTGLPTTEPKNAASRLFPSMKG